MNEDHQTQKIENCEDEIEFIDILLVIWKWKYLIIAGTIFCGVIAAIISLNMAKIYSIDMVLRPGILSIGEQGKNVYIDSPKNIKALIDSGTLNNDILNYLNEIKMENISKKLAFKVTIPVNSNIIKVEYETNNIKQGLVITDYLSTLLIKEYNTLIQHVKSEYDIKLKLLKHKIDSLEAIIQSYKRNVKNIEKRKNELITEIDLIKNSTVNLVTGKNKLLSKNLPKNDNLQNLFYTYLIQKNLELSNNNLNEIYDYKIKKEKQLQKILRRDDEKELKLYDIKKLQFEKENIQNIQILQPATSSRYPIKPKILLNISLSLAVGLFIMLFLGFFLEYMSKYRKRER
jgi:capsular polysaccharide biosynthesis protein